MQRVDALAVARVADDKSMRIKLVAQVESGAGQTYKFPLRVSFFGPAGARAAVAAHLAHTVLRALTLTLTLTLTLSLSLTLTLTPAPALTLPLTRSAPAPSVRSTAACAVRAPPTIRPPTLCPVR